MLKRVNILLSSLLCASLVLCACSNSRSLATSDTVVNKGAVYLITSHSTDGSIGNYSDTAWAIMGLDSAGKYDKGLSFLDNNGSIPSGFLIGIQNPDRSFSSAASTPEGYFEMSEFNTAVAVIALTENIYPVVEPKETKWWLWIVLILLIVSMIIFLYVNTKRRWK